MKNGADAMKAFMPWIMAGPVLVYAVLIFKYAVNFPFLDDYDTIFSHVVLPTNEQFANCFSPHNEHIHWVLRATASLEVWLLEKLNLVGLIWVGVAFFFSFYLSLIMAMRRRALSWIWLIPLPFILFQPSYWGTMTWATTALHNFPGILFAFLAIQYWGKARPIDRGVACLLLVSALFTNGFGIAAVVAIMFWELILLLKPRVSSHTPSSGYSFTKLVMAASILAGWIMFRSAQGGLSISKLLEQHNLFESAHFLANFLGSCIHFLGAPWIIMLALVQLGAFAWLLYHGLFRKNPELTIFIIYLLLCALITTLGRAELGPNQGLASRYRIFSTLLVCCQYLGLAQLHGKAWSTRRWTQPTACGLALVFYSASLYVNVNNLNKIRIRLLEDKARWQSYQPLEEYSHPETAAKLLSEAENAGVFLVRPENRKIKP